MRAFFKSFVYAVNGIIISLKEHRNFRIQFVAAVVVISNGFYFRISSIEWCLIIIAIGLVIGLEMVNTAIENAVDLITLERRPLAGKIKDVAAGAVLLAAIIALVVGIIIFEKYWFT